MRISLNRIETSSVNWPTNYGPSCDLSTVAGGAIVRYL